MSAQSPECAGPAPEPCLDERVRALLSRGEARWAAADVVRSLGPAVLRFIRSSLRDEALAGDAFSAFAEDLLRGLPAFRGDASVRTWAFRVASRALLRVRDDPWRRRRQELRSGAISALAARIRTTTALVRERRARSLEKLSASLSVEDRRLLALRVDQELPWGEIALIVADEGDAVAPGALMKRFQRLKERLGDLARREGLLDG